ncbi:hypothetical protein H7F50_18475 [Novosphingobium flavum]|uniref:hypothetical protein n=1 Tax=Novosphingobium aerophilum TaxID=2839843 RepID=UPI0016399ECA|nr:hypothetical protein [Novosphingobium aerophilum]MBC2663706.1 hypothetical protein [Novosphingobium aerophilum]
MTITRMRDELTLIVDRRDQVELGIGRNPGYKTTALEVTERLGAASAQGQAAGKAAEPERHAELERTIERVKPFEIGL